MRNRFDHLAKEIAKAVFRMFGTAVAHAGITTETQYADLRFEPDPSREVDRGALGLMGRLTTQACIVEFYSEAPGLAEFRACLAKHLAFWHHRTRDARRGQSPPSLDDTVAPFLWIISARAPTGLLAKLELAPAAGWPAGVYFFDPDAFRVGIIVASELPRDPDTVLIRLTAGGPLLGPAIADLAALAPTDPARVIAEPVLLELQQFFGQNPSHEPDEQEFMMAMIKSWEEGRTEARLEGRREGYQELLLRLLRLRFGSQVDARVERRVADSTAEQIEAWTTRVLSAATLDELLAD